MKKKAFMILTSVTSIFSEMVHPTEQIWDIITVIALVLLICCAIYFFKNTKKSKIIFADILIEYAIITVISYFRILDRITYSSSEAIAFILIASMVLVAIAFSEEIKRWIEK